MESNENNKLGFRGYFYGVVKTIAKGLKNFPKKPVYACEYGDMCFLQRLHQAASSKKCRTSLNALIKGSGKDSSLVVEITPEAYNKSFRGIGEKIFKPLLKKHYKSQSPKFDIVMKQPNLQKFVYEISNNNMASPIINLADNLNYVKDDNINSLINKFLKNISEKTYNTAIKSMEKLRENLKKLNPLDKNKQKQIDEFFNAIFERINENKVKPINNMQ